VNEPIVQISDIDKDRFGINVAKSYRVTADNLAMVEDFCRRCHVKMLVARCPTDDFSAVHAMEREGFQLMDTLVYYSRDIIRIQIPNDDVKKVAIRKISTGEEAKVKAVALKAFRGYRGHYHIDDRLDNSQCDEVYISWSVNSCISSDYADEVLVAELNNTIVGFATLRMNNSAESEGVLFGVDPSAQKMGIYRSFMINGMRWAFSKGAERMIVSTQLINFQVQKVWIRLGFEMFRGFYTFHKWFD